MCATCWQVWRSGTPLRGLPISVCFAKVFFGYQGTEGHMSFVSTALLCRMAGVCDFEFIPEVQELF